MSWYLLNPVEGARGWEIKEASLGDYSGELRLYGHISVDSGRASDALRGCAPKVANEHGVVWDAAVQWVKPQPLGPAIDFVAVITLTVPSSLLPLDNVTAVTFDGHAQSPAEARASEAEGHAARCDEPVKRTLAERVRERRVQMGYPRIVDLATAILAGDGSARDPSGHDAALLAWCDAIAHVETEEPVQRGAIDGIAEALGVSAQERDEWRALNGTLPWDLERNLLARPDVWDRVRDLLSVPRGRSVLRPESPAPYSSKGRR